jgi:hypothetical protein
VNSTWSGVANTEADGGHYNLHQLPDKQNLFLGSYSNSYKGGKLFPFLQCDNPCLNNQTSEASVCLPLPRAIAFPGSSGASSHSMFCDRLATQVQDSDCALSLFCHQHRRMHGETPCCNDITQSPFRIP